MDALALGGLAASMCVTVAGVCSFSSAGAAKRFDFRAVDAVDVDVNVAGSSDSDEFSETSIGTGENESVGEAPGANDWSI